MPIKNHTTHMLEQLIQVLDLIGEEEYSTPLPILADNSIGKHCRHVIEFYLCLLDGLHKGLIDYDQRKRDPMLESKLALAKETLRHVQHQIEGLNEDSIKLRVTFPQGSTEMDTTVFRELTYNIEHVVHHMAIIKIGLQSHFPQAMVSKEIGVAYSTMLHAKNVSD